MTTQATEEAEDGGYTVTPSTGTAYERLRRVRPSHFDRPLSDRIAAHAALLALLGVAAGQQWLATNPSFPGGGALAIAPLLGAVGGAILLATGVALVGVAAYRCRREPMSEPVALRAIAVEDGATYLGLVTGVLTVLVAVAAPSLNVGPTLPAPGATTPTVGVAATAGAAAFWAASRWFRGRIPGESSPSESATGPGQY